jgi:hypothetical protein
VKNQVENSFDPLQAAANLLCTIEISSPSSDRLQNLCRALDAYNHAVWILESDDVAPVESVESSRQNQNDQDIRKSICTNFPELGLYWQALDMNMAPDEDGKLAVGDAIDDLLDITKELKEVAWFERHHGREEALAALRFRHSTHLHMHTYLLRAYLEEIVRIG